MNPLKRRAGSGGITMPRLSKIGAVLAPVKHASRRFAVACGHA